MATAPETMTGTTVSIAASTPATEDVSGYAALVYDEIGDVVPPLPEFAENSEEGTLTLLKTGVTQHYNGAKVITPFDITYKYDLTDAGQVICRANANNTTEVSLKVAYPDGKIKYLQAVLANLRTSEATNNSYHGEMILVRPITIATTDDGA